MVLGAERVWSVRGGGRGWGGGRALTAAVRSTSFRLLRMKQASPLSILWSTDLSWPDPLHALSPGRRALRAEAGRAGPRRDPTSLCSQRAVRALTATGPISVSPLTQAGLGWTKGNTCGQRHWTPTTGLSPPGVSCPSLMTCNHLPQPQP